MDPALSNGVVPADEMAQTVDGRNITETHGLASIALLRDDVSKTITRLPTASEPASSDSVLSIYCGEASAKSCSGTSAAEIGAQKKRTLSETSVGETSMAGASSKRANHAVGSSRCSDVTTSDSEDSIGSPTTKSMAGHHQGNRKRHSRSEIIDLTGSDEDENGRRTQLPSCAAAAAAVSIRGGSDYLVTEADVYASSNLPTPINIAITPSIEVRDQIMANAGPCQNSTTTTAMSIGRSCHSAAVHVQICPHARCICHAHCLCCTHIHHPPVSNADPCPRYHHCELHSPCPGPCPHAHPLGVASANGMAGMAQSSQIQTSMASAAANEHHHYRHPCNDRMVTCPGAGANIPYPVGPIPAIGSCYPQSPSMADVHQHVFMRRRQEPPPVVNAASAFPHQQPSHQMPPPGPRSSGDTQYAPGLVVPSLPTVPLAQQRLFQRQQGQMARQREAQQRWLEDRHRAYHQHPAYRTNAGLSVSSSVTNSPTHMPLVNSNENIATAAAAAAVAAAAATASAAFFYPTFFRAMPPQPLSMEPAAAAAAAAAVITQTTVAGPPFQLLQPQEVAVERLFTPAPQTFAVSANGRAMVFHPPAINAIPSFAPYVLVDHHHHHHPHAQWAAGPITLRQLAEFMDLPQGATQQLIEQCTASHSYQPPAKAVPEGEEDKCAVCLSEFERDEHVRTLPCNHIFHVECIDRWLVFNKKCPVCRLHIDRDLQQQHNQHQSSAGGSGAAGNQRANYPSMGSNAFPFSMHGGGRAQ